MSAQAESSDFAEPILLRADSDGVARLTLNRPGQYNALSEDMLDALQAELDAIAGDGSVRVVVLAGAGAAFCAGHDLKEMRARPDRDYYEYLFKKCSRMMLSMVRLPQPVIARAHGIATAAGCQLVANADLAVAASDARFGTSGINVGLFCMTPGVAVTRNVGRKKAFEMLFTGDLLSAAEVLEAGLVNRVAPPGGLDNAVGELCRSILGKPRSAVEAGKRLFHEQLGLDLESAYMRASEEMARNMTFRDTGEGIDAFIARREPVWTHE